MDVQILRAILQSHDEVMKEIEDPQKFDESLEKFPPMDRSVLTALAKSFSDLIRYKVSPEAHQRYSVRIQLIEVLRDWVRPCRELHCSQTFLQSEKVLEFTARILKIYLTNDLLYKDDENIEILINLGKALMFLIPKRKNFVEDLERILNRISKLKQTKESESLFTNALNQRDSLKLGSQTVENLYVAQRVKLIEKPIVENFISNLKASTSDYEIQSSVPLDELLEACVNSQKIFHVSCSVLKEIFVQFDYSPRVLSYIDYFLKSLDSLCQQKKKNMLDLYPLKFQALIILLRILPEYHTSCSRQHTILSLVKMHEFSPEEILILIIHFPCWLHLLTNRLTENAQISIEESHSLTSMIVDDE